MTDATTKERLTLSVDADISEIVRAEENQSSFVNRHLREALRREAVLSHLRSLDFSRSEMTNDEERRIILNALIDAGILDE